MNVNKITIEEIINDLGELVIINSGLNIFLENNNLTKEQFNKLEKINNSLDKKLKEIQDTLLKVEGISQDIFEVLEIFVEDNIYLLPMNMVKRVVNTKECNIKNNGDLILEKDNLYNILDLKELFFKEKINGNSIIIITKNDLCLKISQTGKNKQILVKNLEKNYDKTKYFIGAGFNGLGNVELILDVNKIKNLNLLKEIKKKDS